MRRYLLPLLVLLALAGCGPSVIVPLESARTPDGAQAAAPPRVQGISIGAKHIDGAGLLLIERFEGFSSTPYWDAYGHVWTRGFGETEGIHSYSPSISRAQGGTHLKLLVESRYEWALRQLGTALNQNQWNALTSFVWNLGAGIFQGTTIGAELRSRNFRGAAQSMLAYVHAGGQVLAGLVTRRRLEVALFLKPVTPPPFYKTHELGYRIQLRILIRRLHCHHAVRPHKRECALYLKHGREVNERLHAHGIH